MKKTGLAATISEKFSISKKKSGDIISTALESISDALKNGDSVSFIGFGKFVVKKRKPRVGINPATGAAIEIPVRKTVVFKVGKKLKKAVN